jgi:hypothetical protein
MADNLVTVATYNTSVEATLAKNYLQSAGIRAVLSDDTTVDMAWHLGVALGGVKLQVLAEDAERAEEVLEELHPEREIASAEGEPAETEGAGTPEESEEAPPNKREENARRAVRGAVLGLLLWPLELYVFWLLMKVLLSDDPLTPETRRLALFAACINLPFMILCCWLLGQFL